MFRYAPQGKVYWPLTLEARNPDTGDIIEGKAFVLYSLLTRSELKAREKTLTTTLAQRIIASPNSKEALADLNKLADEMEAIDRKNDDDLVGRIHGWKDFTDQDNKPLPFDEATLRAMLDDPLLHEKFARGLIDASKGAKAKNSQPGPAGTPARGQS